MEGNIVLEKPIKVSSDIANDSLEEPVLTTIVKFYLVKRLEKNRV